jgi:iron complex transport system substrate-binding protein
MMKVRFLFTVLLILSLTSLALPWVSAQDAAPAADCVTDYDSSMDYFPDKVTVDYAEGFTVEYHDNYKLVTVVQPWQGAEQPVSYVLVQCGTPAPDDVGDAVVIEVPVQTVASLSTSFLPHIVGQGLLDRLVAIDTSLYTSAPEVLAGVEAGEVAQVGGGGSGQEVNVEQLIDLQPGLILTQQFYSDDPSLVALEQTGLPFAVDADFLDTSPLGVAEWGKFISLFFNTEASAQEAFDGVVGRYNDLVALTATTDEQPTVFAGTPYEGTWFMPGGQSYVAQLLADAGADYLWKDDSSTGSLFLDFETVFDTAVDADYWVNVSQFWATLADAQADDERYTGFAAFQNGNIYSNNARVNENGGSDYYESGYANPDIILADLVAIFHPDLIPNHELYFYKKLAE